MRGVSHFRIIRRMNARSMRVPDAYPRYHEAKRENALAFEKRYPAGLLELADGNLTLAASIAGMHRAAIYRMLKRHGLTRKIILAPAAPTTRAAKVLERVADESRRAQRTPGRRRQVRRKAE